MAAAEEARGAEAKGPRRRRRSARLDGDDEGGARASDGDEGGGEGGGARGGYRWRWAAVEKRAVTEKAAADIEWKRRYCM